jgi:hypothetical protein
MVNELVGTFPRLPYLHAQQIVNRSWTRIRDLRLWSWQLIVDGQIFTPNLINAGTVSVNQFNTFVYLDAAAEDALNNDPDEGPPIEGEAGVGRVIRIGNYTGIQPTGGDIYNIIDWRGSYLVIDKPFAQSDVTDSPYQIYRPYFVPPALPFTNLDEQDLAWIRPVSFNNRQGNYTIRRRRMFYTQDELNAIDPMRMSQDSYAWGIAPYMRNQAGTPVYEFYPHPTLANVYSVTYYSRWPSLSAAQDLPQVPYGLPELVMDLSRSMAAQFMLTNTSTFADLQNTNWVATQQMYKQDYMDGLKQCLKVDDEMMPQVPFIQGRLLDLPLGGAFLQNHDISFLLNR